MAVKIKYFLLSLIVLVSVSGNSFAAQGSKVFIESDGTLNVNGKKIITYGTFHEARDDWGDMSRMKEAGFNLVHDYKFESLLTNYLYHQNRLGNREAISAWSDEEIKDPLTAKFNDEMVERYLKESGKFLDKAAKQGMGVFLGVPRQLVKQGDLPVLKRLVEGLKDNPGLWLWYLYDEPSEKHHKLKTFDDCYKTIRKTDPNHPVILVNYRKQIKSKLNNCCDMLWVDEYPTPSNILPIKEIYDTAGKLFPKKPIMAVLGASSDLLHYGIIQRNEKKNPLPLKTVKLSDENYRPNALEIRAQAYTALAAGSKGMVWYWWPVYRHDIYKDTPKVWAAISDLGAEMKNLEQVLLADKPKKPIKFSASYLMKHNEPKDLRKDDPEKVPELLVLQKEYEGAIYAVIVNAGYQPHIKVEFTLPYEISGITQYRGKAVEQIVSFNKDNTAKIEHSKTPVVVWEIPDRKHVSIFLGETQGVIWRFDTGSAR